MPNEGNVFYYGENGGVHIVRIDKRTFRVVATSRDEAIKIAIQANLT